MSNSETESKSTLFLSLQYLKNNDFDTSIKILGITEKQAKENDYVNCMMALEQGLNSLFSGHHSEAAESLRKTIPLINLANDTEAKFIIPILADFSEGISLLIQGDAHRAVKLLKLSSDTIQRVNFFIPGFEKFMLGSKAAAEVALARTYLNIGDMASVESIIGNIIQIHDELLSKLDKSNEKDFPAFNEVFGTQIEFSLIFMRYDLEVLDFDSLTKRVEFTKKNIIRLNHFIGKIPQTPIKTATEIIQILYEVYETYSRIGKKIISERSPLTREEINELLIAETKIFEARQKANLAGDRGKIFLYIINQLKRLNENFLRIGKVQKTDFGRMSGFIALCSLIIQITIVHLTIKPSGFEATIFFFGEIILSLIVGFGYEALKFKPLLHLYSKTIQRKTKKE